MNKKASLMDSILVPFYIMVIGMTIFIAYYTWSEFTTSFTPIAITSAANETLIRVMDDVTTSLSYLDYMFPMLVAGLLIVSLIFAFKTGAGYYYAFLSVIMWILALLMSPIISNTFSQFITEFPTESTVFSTIVYILSKSSWLCFVWAVLISAVMFTRTKKDEQNISAAEGVFQ